MKRVFFLFALFAAFAVNAQYSHTEEGEATDYSHVLTANDIEFGVTLIADLPADVAGAYCDPCPGNSAQCCPQDPREDKDHLQAQYGYPDGSISTPLDRIMDGAKVYGIQYGTTRVDTLSPELSAMFCGPCAPYCCPPSDDRGDDENDW